MQNPIDKMFFLGYIAGIWVGFGGIAGESDFTNKASDKNPVYFYY
jgi:hypothetical protein